MKRFSIIYADPPWLYNERNNASTRFGLGMHRYPGMKTEEIAALPVRNLADDNAALFMWTVSPMPKDALMVMEAWGFRHVTKAFTWLKVSKEGKPRLLPGHYTGSNTEDVQIGIRGQVCAPDGRILDPGDILEALDCLLGIRGRMQVSDKGVNQVIISTLDEHSRKPAETRERIRRLFPYGQALELFAREKTPGWSVWGNQVESDIHMTDYNALEGLTPSEIRKLTLNDWE